MKYLKKFGNVTAGNAPLEFTDEGGGWDAWTANEYFSVETNTEAFDGQALKFNYSSVTARYSCKWGPLGDAVGDCEVLARFKTGSLWSSKWKCLIGLRCSDNGSYEDGYFVDIYNGSLQIATYTVGAYASRATGSLAWTSDEWVYIRARVVDDENNDPVVSAKIWAIDEAEPDDWDITYTDDRTSGFNASGWCGLIGSNAAYECDFLSFTDDPENESAPFEIPALIDNFKADTIGETPSRYTSRWTASNDDFEVAADTDAIMQRVCGYTSSSMAFIGHDSTQFSPNFTDGEVLVRFKLGTSTVACACVGIRDTGVGAVLTSYMCRLTSGNLELLRYDSLNKTLLTSQTGGSVSIDTYYWMRVRIEDKHLYGKIWAASVDEPATWTIDHDDTTGTITSGTIVLGDYSGDTSYDYVSVGYGDDPAPMVVEQDFRHLSTFTDEFTDQWQTGTSFSRVASTEGIGGQYMNVDVNSSNPHLYTWDKVPAAVDDVEFLAKVWIDNRDTEIFRFFARASGDWGSNTADAYVGILGDSSRSGLRRYDDSVISEIQYAYTYGTIYLTYWAPWWIRFRVNGTSLKIKWWAGEQPEPLDWRIETTDSTYSSGTLGHGFAFHSLNANEYLDYFAMGFNGDSPQVPPEDEVHPLSEFGVAPHCMYLETTTSNLNGCVAQSYRVPYCGKRIAGVLYFTYDEPFDNNFRVAVYVNSSMTDMSNATLVEDFGQPTDGQPRNANALYFSDGPKMFAPGTVLWIAFKSDNATVALGYTPDTGVHIHTGSGRVIYTTDLGSDETVAFASTTGTLTGSSGTSIYSFSFFLEEGRYHSADRFFLDFADADLGVGVPDGWRESDYYSDLTLEVVSNANAYGGKHLNVKSVGLYTTNVVPLETERWHRQIRRSMSHQVLTRFEIELNYANIGVMTRTYDGGARGYTVRFDALNNNIVVFEQTGLSTKNQLTSVSKTLAEDTWYWATVQKHNGRVRAKVWTGRFYDEPATWDLDWAFAGDYQVSGCPWGQALITQNDSSSITNYDFWAQATAPYFNIGVASDDFTGTDNDPPDSSLWTNVDDGFEELVIYNNQLRCERQGMASWEYPHAILNQTLADDFTMVVDFDLQTVRENAANASGFYLWVEDSSGDEVLQIGAGYYDGQTFIWRETTGGTAQGWEYTSRTNSTGKLAIVRSGTTITLKYQDGTGAWATADTFSSKWITDTTFVLRGTMQTSYHATDAYSDFRFDNFKLYDFVDVLDLVSEGSGGASYKPAIMIVT